MCPTESGNDVSLSTGLEGMWAALIVISIAWCPFSLCLLQTVKHAQQVRMGRKEVLDAVRKTAVELKSSANENLDADDEGNFEERFDDDLSISSSNKASICSARKPDLQLLLVLGGSYLRVETGNRPRVCREVHDGLASCLDIPPAWLEVSCNGYDDSGLMVCSHKTCYVQIS